MAGWVCHDRDALYGRPEVQVRLPATEGDDPPHDAELDINQVQYSASNRTGFHGSQLVRIGGWDIGQR